MSEVDEAPPPSTMPREPRVPGELSEGRTMTLDTALTAYIWADGSAVPGRHPESVPTEPCARASRA